MDRLQAFHARLSTNQLGTLQQSLMLDEDELNDTEVDHLNRGILWATFEELEADGIGELEFSANSSYDGHCTTQPTVTDFESAKEFVEVVLGLQPVEDSTGVHCWGTFEDEL